MTVENDPLIGQKFGKLKVVELSGFYVKPSDGKREKRYRCECDCGGEAITSKRKLQTGHTNSCGCIRAKRGGRSSEEEYNVWNLMVNRCHNPNFTGYYKYGALGTEVCESWRDRVSGYDSFISDMGKRPTDKHTLERVDVNLGYCPDNCVWTDDLSLQCYNRKLLPQNTSGRTGVRLYHYKKTPRWVAIIRKGEVFYQKYFSTFEEAVAQREQWELELYGFIKDE